MNVESLKTRLDELISFAHKIEATKSVSRAMGHMVVSEESALEFRAAGLSFVSNLFGEQHTFYREFDKATDKVASTYYMILRGRGVLQAIKQELDGGWMFTVKSIVSAEIFTDFLDMASYLLAEKYKDPAAVIIGGVLEEHLRQLCAKNGIESTYQKDGKDLPKTADRMNNELASASVYGKLYQKSVTGWLDLRNKAAHGHYADYDIKQVQLMEAGVLDFIAKMSGV